MFCGNCGANIDSRQKFCHKCGAKNEYIDIGTKVFVTEKAFENNNSATDNNIISNEVTNNTQNQTTPINYEKNQKLFQKVNEFEFGNNYTKKLILLEVALFILFVIVASACINDVSNNIKIPIKPPDLSGFGGYYTYLGPSYEINTGAIMRAFIFPSIIVSVFCWLCLFEGIKDSKDKENKSFIAIFNKRLVFNAIKMLYWVGIEFIYLTILLLVLVDTGELSTESENSCGVFCLLFFVISMIAFGISIFRYTRTRQVLASKIEYENVKVTYLSLFNITVQYENTQVRNLKNLGVNIKKIIPGRSYLIGIRNNALYVVVKEI